MWEINALSLFSFNFIGIKSNFSHMVFIFCATPGSVVLSHFLKELRTINIVSQCFFSGKFCKWIQNLIIEVSVKINVNGLLSPRLNNNGCQD